MARKTIAQIKFECFEAGVADGMRRAGLSLQTREKELDWDKARARNAMMVAAADLASANAKLTYALSRILNEKGW